MLDAANPWGRRVRPYICRHVRAELAREDWQRQAYFRLRALIFAEEQGLFYGSDVDAHDAYSLPIVALSSAFGMDDEVVGVVRIYSEEPQIWYGGRLGVAAAYRTQGSVGTALIECAVSSAHALGARRFFATVQDRNVRYFERRHFHALRALEILGHPHQLMEADLAHFPPARGLSAAARAA